MNKVESIRALCSSGALQTAASIHYGEATSAEGWRHINVTVHQHGAIQIALYVGISPEGDDTPARLDTHAITLTAMLSRLTDWVAENRKQEAAA